MKEKKPTKTEEAAIQRKQWNRAVRGDLPFPRIDTDKSTKELREEIYALRDRIGKLELAVYEISNALSQAQNICTFIQEKQDEAASPPKT